MDANIKLVKLQGDVEARKQRLATAEKAAADNPRRDKDSYYRQQVEIANTKLFEAENKLLALQAEIEAKKAAQEKEEKKSEEMAEKVITESAADFGIRWHDYVGEWYAYYDGIWRKLPITLVKDYLGAKHEIPDESEEGYPSPAGMVMQNAIEHFSVDYAGNFAGYLKVGEYPTAGGGRLLITKGRKILEAKKGNWKFLCFFLRKCFKRRSQFLAFCDWLRAATISLQQPIGSWNHGQALLMVGETGKGKSTLQFDVIDPLLADHHADAACFLKGESTFNAQLGEAEHWLMSDPKKSNQKEQEIFLSGVKEAIANVWMNIHPKGKTPIDLPTYRRLTITLNDEPRALSIVSDLAKSEAEKILMLNFEDPGKFAPNGKEGLSYADWKAKIQEQLPAFKWYLLNEFKLPKKMGHPRFGVQYTNPDLSKKLSAPSQAEIDEDLDGMILDSCFEHRTMTVGGKADWILVNRVEMTAGQVIDRLTGARNPARDRAKKIYETQQARRMTTLLTRFCNENNGQRNGYSIQRRKLKKDHHAFILERTLASNNGSAPSPSISSAGLASLASRMREVS